eukprot:2533505-Rhodomonas_salina.4
MKTIAFKLPSSTLRCLPRAWQRKERQFRCVRTRRHATKSRQFKSQHAGHQLTVVEVRVPRRPGAVEGERELLMMLQSGESETHKQEPKDRTASVRMMLNAGAGSNNNHTLQSWRGSLVLVCRTRGSQSSSTTLRSISGSSSKQCRTEYSRALIFPVPGYRGLTSNTIVEHKPKRCKGKKGTAKRRVEYSLLQEKLLVVTQPNPACIRVAA